MVGAVDTQVLESLLDHTDEVRIGQGVIYTSTETKE